jgi:signal transduction histidine kinase/ligand-binding sensor domain-containing protein
MNPLRLMLIPLLVGAGLARAQVWQELEALAETSPDYVVSRWSMEDGLPSDRVRAVLQTRDGFVWGATFNGLARFDGVNFRVFNDANTPALKNRLVNRLHEDAEGRMWIGMDTGELVWRDAKGFHSLPIANAWHTAPISRMAHTTNGTLLVLNRDGQLLWLTNGPSGEVSLAPPSPLYSDLIVDTENQVWLVRRGGVMLQWQDGAELPNRVGPPPTAGYRTACAARRGGFWVRDGQRLRRWHDGQWVEDRGTHSWGDRRPVVMREISTGDVLVGTPDLGLFIVDESGGERRLNRENGLAHNWVESIWEDREKNIWVGANGGGLQLLRSRVLSMLTPSDRWQNQPVQSVAPARDGGVWVGTLGAGIYRYDERKFQHWVEEENRYSPYVRAILEDRNGRVWIGAEGMGVYWLQDGKYGRLELPASFPRLIYGLSESKDGAIWVSTQNGVIRLADGGFERLGVELVQADTRCAVQSPDGAIWLGMRGGGVARYQQGEVTQFMRPQGLPYEYVWALCADADGAIWIGTSGGGLARYRDGQFVNFTTRQGLPSDFICHIEPDELGNLWVASYGGIFRVDKGDLDRCARGELSVVNCLVLDASEGLASLEMAGGNQPSGCRTADGRFWFATSRGLAVVDPDRLKVVRVPPPVVVEDVLVDGESHAGMTDPNADELVIPPGSGRIEFHYAGLSYGAPKRVRFKFQMQGLDPEWVDAGNRRVAFYTHLAPGSYRFRVIACNHFGYWNEEGAEIRLRVLPHYWQTWWFTPLCWVAGAGMVGALVIGLLRRRHHRKLELVQRARLIEQERARIAHDLHDDLGSGLTEIHTTSALGLDPSVPAHEANEYFREISQRAREMVMALDEIVWAVNPKNDNLGSLANYFCHYTEQFLRSTNIGCRFDVASALPALPLASNQRHSLFLALKEALNNAVRHSGARSVTLGIRVDAGSMCIEVSDDGRGFDPGMARPGADGLASLRMRLENLGGRCEITSQSGAGTRVQFILPLRRAGGKGRHPNGVL